jgi:hypothetical protein
MTARLNFSIAPGSYGPLSKAGERVAQIRVSKKFVLPPVVPITILPRYARAE